MDIAWEMVGHRPKEVVVSKPRLVWTAAKVKERVADLWRRALDQALRATNGNIKEAAEQLGIQRPVMYLRMKTLGLKRDAYRRRGRKR